MAWVGGTATGIGHEGMCLLVTDTDPSGLIVCTTASAAGGGLAEAYLEAQCGKVYPHCKKNNCDQLLQCQ